MEEKERYEYHYYDYDCTESYIYDNATDCEYSYLESICDLLNQCDKRIKELEQGLKTRKGHINILEERNKVLLKLIGKLYKELFPDGRAVTYEKCIDDAISQIKEIQQLNQQLHDLPKKIVCEISEAIERLSWRKRIYTNWEFDKEQLYKDLDTILKKYGEKDEN